MKTKFSQSQEFDKNDQKIYDEAREIARKEGISNFLLLMENLSNTKVFKIYVIAGLDYMELLSNPHMNNLKKFDIKE